MVGLMSEEGREFLLEKYVRAEWSVREVALALDQPPSAVRRAMVHHGIARRSRSEAQRSAIRRGKAAHPTEGAARPQDVKDRIGRACAENWQEQGDERRKERAEEARRRWEETPHEKREDFLQKAHRAVRQTAERGSRLERHLLVSLRQAGHEVEFHRKYLVANELMHLDVVLPRLRVVIEVDGPSHFRPIWGEERLQATRERDRRKNGLVLGAGYRLIRLRQESREMNAYRAGEAVRRVLEALGSEFSYLEIGV